MHIRKLFIVLAAILTISLIGLSATCLAPGEAPTIELEVYDGPDYSESDGMCYYRVEAKAEGMPEPEIEFAEDDNINPLGSDKVEVGVEIGGSYTLEATATNSAGTASVSFILDGDCDEEATDEETAEEEPETDSGDSDSDENGDADADGDGDGDADGDSDGDADIVKEEPTISLEIYEGPTLEGSICYYRVRATVDGSPSPTVSFNRDDSGGAWLPNRVQVNLNNPSDTFTLSATATNSEGSDTDSIDLSWGCEEPEPESEPEPEVHEVPIAVNPDISGVLSDAGSVDLISDYAYMGDSRFGNYFKSYFSFDISGLHGKTVQDAEIIFTGITSYGDPSSLASEIVIKVFNYVRLDASDWAIGGVQLPSIPFSGSLFPISGNTLKNELQAVLDNSVRDYFQLKLGLNGTTNGNGVMDGIMIHWSDAILNITYTD
ncbi:hypothetical protein ACFLQQ_01990 [Actinomycetota bacterium]